MWKTISLHVILHFLAEYQFVPGGSAKIIDPGTECSALNSKNRLILIA